MTDHIISVSAILVGLFNILNTNHSSVGHWNLDFLNAITLTVKHSTQSVWSRFFDNLIGTLLAKKFSAFYEARRLVTPLARARLPVTLLCQISPVHGLPLYSVSINLILRYFIRLVFSSGLISSGFPNKVCSQPSCPLYKPHIQPITIFFLVAPCILIVLSPLFVH